MSKKATRHRWYVWILVSVAALAGGCDNYGWLSLNIVIPLGLDGDVGLLNPFGEGSIFAPPQNGTDNEPPLPIIIPEDPGGGGNPGGTNS
ncbi:MAG TPA: hypothetical protein PLQ89_08035 [Phycisphaerae bacterium]|nr:hypothetical protein [Phycisphaerae bacterium]HOJ74803.1 hypothetical protein [Phycisphaerae bacterium]HOM51966.1 hypothetical protein [Phycisphaerae bacterium]HON66007.1 hypothetical protein [Phycisphaerae bacterium]HOQ85655.1 hypothetical protein [Phycisphaerae bacterium]